ncbi:MAG: hypothetical protein FWD32_01145 [Firmicutes bacterium]|nr:hypothetical protein [Bacillota bacterium]
MVKERILNVMEVFLPLLIIELFIIRLYIDHFLFGTIHLLLMILAYIFLSSCYKKNKKLLAENESEYNRKFIDEYRLKSNVYKILYCVLIIVNIIFFLFISIKGIQIFYSYKFYLISILVLVLGVAIPFQKNKIKKLMP